MTAVKYMDRGWILKANTYAIKRGWKETLSMTTIYSIKEDALVPISFMLPEDYEIICVYGISRKAKKFLRKTY